MDFFLPHTPSLLSPKAASNGCMINLPARNVEQEQQMHLSKTKR